MESSYEDYSLTDDPACVDLDVVCELLRDTYFSVHRAGRQVGIARVLTDHGASSYICDVVIHPQHRDRGIGKWLMRSQSRIVGAGE